MRTSDHAVTLNLKGARAFRAPVCLTIQIKGFKLAAITEQLLGRMPELIARPPRTIRRTQYQITMRNALIAIDGEAVGATHFEVAAAIFGEARPREERMEEKRSAKEVARRARAKGRQLRDGGYRELIRGRVSARAAAVRHSQND